MTTAIVPYYLDPGVSTVHGSCIEGVYPALVEIEVSSSIDGIVELWRPIRTPWVESDRPAGAAPPPLMDDAYAGTDGELGVTVPVHALCDPRIPRSGARFVFWTDTNDDSDFFAVEFPVPDGGYDSVDGGVVISADETAEQAVFGGFSRGNGIRVSALCVATPTPFTPEAEPDLPRLLL